MCCKVLRHKTDSSTVRYRDVLRGTVVCCESLSCAERYCGVL